MLTATDILGASKRLLKPSDVLCPVDLDRLAERIAALSVRAHGTSAGATLGWDTRHQWQPAHPEGDPAGLPSGKIKHAVLVIGGKRYKGPSHFQALTGWMKETGNDFAPAEMEWKEGFETESGHFLDRQQAADYHVTTKSVRRELGKAGLKSEHLNLSAREGQLYTQDAVQGTHVAPINLPDAHGSPKASQWQGHPGSSATVNGADNVEPKPLSRDTLQRRENDDSSELHTIASAGATPAPATILATLVHEHQRTNPSGSVSTVKEFDDSRKVGVGHIPARMQLAKPIQGPTGAKIVGYEWRSHIDDVWHEGKQEMVAKRVSDWDSSDTSKGTGRNIVHVFHVQHPAGHTTVEGIRSAQNILGIAESRLQTIAKKERAAQQYRIEQDKAESAIWEKGASATPAEAAQLYRKRNYSSFRTFEENNADFYKSDLWEKGGKFVRRHDGAAEQMTGWGWNKVEPDPAKASLLPSQANVAASDPNTILAREPVSTYYDPRNEAEAKHQEAVKKALAVAEASALANVKEKDEAKAKRRREESAAIALLLLGAAGAASYALLAPHLLRLAVAGAPSQGTLPTPSAPATLPEAPAHVVTPPAIPEAPTPAQPLGIAVSPPQNEPAPVAEPTPEQESDMLGGKTLEQAAEDFADERAEFLKPFCADIQEAMRLEVEIGKANGESIHQIGRRLFDLANGIGRSRGALIAATEAQSAYGHAQLRALAAAGYRTANWVQVDRETKRESHAANMAVGPLPIGDTWPNGQKFPGDPTGGPGECINCLCELTGADWHKPKPKRVLTRRQKLRKERLAKRGMAKASEPATGDTVQAVHIKEYERKTKTGGVAEVHEHEDKRTKQAAPVPMGKVGDKAKELAAGVTWKHGEAKPDAKPAESSKFPEGPHIHHSREAGDIEMRDATPEERKQLAIPPAYGVAKVPTNPDSPILWKAIAPNGKVQLRRSETQAGKQLQAKHERGHAFQKELPEIKAAWEKEIKDGGKNLHEALVLRLIHQTGFRNGGEGGGGKVAAFGASSLRAEHVTVEGDKIHFKFTGKGGHLQEHELTDAVLAKHFANRKEEGNDRMFDTHAGKVLDYLHTIDGQFIVHDFRTHVATRTAAAEIAKRIESGMPKSVKEAKEWMKEALALAAEKIGDTIAVAKSTYVNPQVFARIGL